MRPHASRLTAMATATLVSLLATTAGLHSAYASASYSDTFNRTVPSGWGISSSGYAWGINFGSSSAFSVNGSTGQIVAPASTTEEAQLALAPADSETLLRFATNKVATGASQALYVYARRTSDSTWYRFGIALTTSSSVTAAIYRDVAGTQATVAASTTSLVASPGRYLMVRARVQGSSLSLRVWQAGTTEPTAWTLTANDTSVVGAGTNPIRAYVGPAANAPVTYSVDDYSLTDFGGAPGPTPTATPTATPTPTQPGSAAIPPQPHGNLLTKTFADGRFAPYRVVTYPNAHPSPMTYACDYGSGSDVASVHDGYLDLRAYPKANGRWACGFVSTGMDGLGDAAAFSFTTGYVQVAAELSIGFATWQDPLWMMNTVTGWQSSAEIDAAEVIDGRPTFYIHGPANLQVAAHAVLPVWHIYGVAKSSDHITFTVDGQVVGRWNGSMPDPLALLADSKVGFSWEPTYPNATTPNPTYSHVAWITVDSTVPAGL